MAGVNTPGIRANRNGQQVVDKAHRGVRIYARLGCASQAQAEEYLTLKIERVDRELDRKANARLRFADGAARYLKESENKRSVDVTAWHIRMLIPYIGTLELDRIHDTTLQHFIADRLAKRVTATTINRSLEVVRTVLNRAARAYRDEGGRPWLTGMPPLITMLPESRRAPYPITWAEQERLFSEVARTSCQDGAICGQYWPPRKQCVRTAMDVGSGGA
ncbi:hypothetical protein ANRL3_00680 [Anaerolineae bacterium]|nr:hypothetical protein ANRL3_00680 [Anaerolineae bacterium]